MRYIIGFESAKRVWKGCLNDNDGDYILTSSYDDEISYYIQKPQIQENSFEYIKDQLFNLNVKYLCIYKAAPKIGVFLNYDATFDFVSVELKNLVVGPIIEEYKLNTHKLNLGIFSWVLNHKK